MPPERSKTKIFHFTRQKTESRFSFSHFCIIIINQPPSHYHGKPTTTQQGAIAQAHGTVCEYQAEVTP